MFQKVIFISVFLLNPVLREMFWNWINFLQKEIQFISKKKKLNYMFQSRILFVIGSIRVFETLISRYLRAWNVKTMTLKKQFKCILLLKMATIAFFWHIYKYHWFVLSYNILKENWFCYKIIMQIIRYFPPNMI